MNGWITRLPCMNRLKFSLDRQRKGNQQPEAEAEPATADPVQNEFDEMVLKLPWATLLLESLGSELEEAVSCCSTSVRHMPDARRPGTLSSGNRTGIVFLRACTQGGSNVMER